AIAPGDRAFDAYGVPVIRACAPRHLPGARQKCIPLRRMGRTALLAQRTRLAMVTAAAAAAMKAAAAVEAAAPVEATAAMEAGPAGAARAAEVCGAPVEARRDANRAAEPGR